MTSPLPVLLVGSVPLESAEALFEAAGAALGRLLARVPDGETGARKNWIGWQHAAFARQDALERIGERQRDYQLHPPYRIKPGRTAADLDFGDLGFAREALASYAAFRRVRDAGGLPAHVRFQVALPTPFAPVYSFIAYDWQAAVLPVYTARLLAELAEICAAIPHADLAVQWDVATEMSIFEKVYDTPFPDAEAFLIAQLAALCDAVPADVELGIHLCYGSMNNKHWKEPADLGMCVTVANAVARAVRRPIQFLHVPVPVARDDDAYFAPLSGLALNPETLLYLGLVHDSDGAEGTRRRIATARRHVDKFGIGAECGFGRRDASEVARILDVHRDAAGGR